MPTYDYQCDGCGHAFEEWQSFKDDALSTCPECKAPKLRRLFGGGAAIIFKGSGFYDTDYRQKDAAKKAGAKPDGDGKPADKPADAPAKTDATPAGDGGAKPAAGKADKAGG